MKNILLIDDDDIIQKIISKVLERNGFNVVSGGDGKEGVDKLNMMKYDLVITDIMMPYLNGFEFIQELRRHPNGKDARIIIFSSITNEDAIRDSKNMGVDLYLSKPIVINEFIDTVKTLLG
ncbi:response regulator [Rurimicrobium arvi]|uniref:Response regulator n=1 Tax=Rurimicrobium arvi TaxID=2049916 RepID=A0ABP8N388_9BACT